MRVLVSGGAGYIGSFTVAALQADGHEVVSYDNMSFGHREAVTSELVEADLADHKALDRCLSRGEFGAVLHFAASIEAGDSMIDAGRFFQNNVSNSVSLLNAAQRNGVKHIVFSSSAGVYGDPVRLPIAEEDDTVPINTYAETKLLVERMLPWYRRVHGMNYVALRYFNAAGAALDGSHGQDHHPATHIVTVAVETALGQRSAFPMFGHDYPTPDGTCIRDYIHVLDLASAHVRALKYLAEGGESGPFNVGAGRGYSNWDVVSEVKQVSGVDFPVEIMPRRAGDPVQLVAGTDKIQRVFGWQAQYSDLRTIVSSAWQWATLHPNGYGS